ncbi:EboA domain-containing protein [Paralimibaculum aggregatum]|uniref:EboA domain-containing protein n=1 Tax=Paralimibaculum aggregatum TaxID=3036245 RepID=A0ABQ6LLQ9_9RHOB|nr:EboA domain-containing protein [Limibaculum sp. NKW23]GMG84139.1 EboA domain-containing protein [Limibaculum sp. NKW23]
MTTAIGLLGDWVLARAGAERGWVEASLAELAAGAPERALHIFLGLAPRRLGKGDLALDAAALAAAEAARPGWRPGGWSLDGAARVLGLLSFRGSRPFAETFKDLRRTADVAEMIALYRGLPLYPGPEALDFEVGEGLRSNLRPVFEAIAHDNPWPRDHFDQHRWNHMVLKALFVDSPLAPIIGLDERANPELARILIDYAEERWAAGRPVTPELWRPVKPFAALPEIRAGLERARASGHMEELPA